MADDCFESAKDCQTESRSTSRSLIDEVNSNREDFSKSSSKAADYQNGSDSAVNTILGSLQIVDNSTYATSKSADTTAPAAGDSTPNKPGDSAPSKPGDPNPTAPANSSDSTPSKPGDANPTAPANSGDTTVAAPPPKTSDSSLVSSLSGLSPEATRDSLSFWHPIDSAKEIYHKVKGDAPKPEDKPADKPTDNSGDKPGDPKDQFASPEKAHLKQLESKLPPADKAQFDKDMADFEKRAAEAKPPLSPEQVAKTYEQISRLIDAPDNPNGPKIDASQRMKIAEQILNHAAHPENIDQGQHGSCGAATAESLAFTRNPQDAAKMITDVALSGKFEDKSHKVTTPDAGTLTFAEKHQYDYPPANGERSMASQIFQVTAISMEKPSFKQVTPTGPDDTGERMDTFKPGGGVFDKQTVPFDGLQNDQILDINKRITGDSKGGSYIENVRDQGNDNNPKDGRVYVDSPQQLGEQLQRMKSEGKLPAIIVVNSQNEPFFSDSHGAKAGGAGGGHVVTITDYDPATGKVSMDNQWGKGSDHTGTKAVSLNEMYRATLPPGDHATIENLKQEIAKNKSEGKADPSLELELLRQKHLSTDKADHIDDKEYQAEIKKTMLAAIKKWDEQEGKGGVDEDERRRTWVKFAEVNMQLPQDQSNKEMLKAITTELQNSRKHGHNQKNPLDYYMEYKKDLDGP